jgi:D-alanyl-lipoteichoic acid acyltransferase DltB (MBOAT superfamily)
LLFSSTIFIFLFLPCALSGYHLLSRFGRTAMLGWLAAISLVFYAYWDPVYLSLLAASILMNFCFSYGLGQGKPEAWQNRCLFTAIAANLTLLMYYKYLFPFLNFLYGRGLLGHGFPDVILPLGISFFTFTQIAYLVDLRQQVAKREGLLSYSVFVTFFPHLIAGPLIHPRDLLPQLETNRIRGPRAYDMAVGLSWFVLGLGKKVLIADRIAPLADFLYQHPHSAGLFTAWLGALAYAMQLYFDFSGYSDMAVALARMFSIELPLNFDSPYKARSYIELWQRWHMTLSRYLNEYLYTPAVNWVCALRIARGKKISRKAAATPEGFLSMVFFPLMWTMTIAGVWHGAGFQFLIFGALQGIFLTLNHAWRYLTPKGSRFHDVIPAPLSVVITFLGFLVGLIFFRSGGIHDALYILGSMVGLHRTDSWFSMREYMEAIPHYSFFIRSGAGCVVSLALLFFVVWSFPNTQEIFSRALGDRIGWPSSVLPNLTWRPVMAWSLGLTVVFCLAILMLDAGTRFLYFQF